MADLAAPVPQPGGGLPHGVTLRLDQFPCIDCGGPDAPIRGELRTEPIGPGVVRNVRAWRCTDCQLKHLNRRAATWLASVAGDAQDDIVRVWGRKPDELRPLPCGVRWDVVRVAEELGQPVLGRLLTGGSQDIVGPVLRNERAGVLCWLVRREEAPARWTGLPVRVLSRGSYLAAPNPDAETGGAAPWVWWPELTGILTPPALLAAAIERELPGGDR